MKKVKEEFVMCPVCQNTVSVDWDFCPHCDNPDAEPNENFVLCIKCQMSIPDDYEKCPHCGTKQF